MIKFHYDINGNRIEEGALVAYVPAGYRSIKTGRVTKISAKGANIEGEGNRPKEYIMVLGTPIREEYTRKYFNEHYPIKKSGLGRYSNHSSIQDYADHHALRMKYLGDLYDQS